MNQIDEYRLFVPPPHLNSRHPREWSGSEAKDYKDWLLENSENRIDEMLAAFGEPLGPAPRDHLAALGEKVSIALKNAPFSEEHPSGRKLSDAGYALAADMGLLVAMYLVSKHHLKIRWETIRKPKSELSYNLPVLEGFENGNYLDPVGGSTAEASAILTGRRGHDIWAKIYTFWDDVAD